MDKKELERNIAAMRAKIEEAERLMKAGEAEKAEAVMREAASYGEAQGPAAPEHSTRPTVVPEGSRVIEGVFDGQHMMGADGKQYLVPPNYASKSKLVEGDMMKLAITIEGAFVYKQIGPIARKRVTCALAQSENGMWQANDGVHSWRLLTAAVTYFHGKAGDEAVILIPSGTPSKWAAVENIIAR